MKLLINTATTSTYEVIASVLAPNNGSNSFFVQIDGGAVFGWHPSVSSTYVESTVATLSLAAGDHTIGFYLREDGTRLDYIRLVDLGSIQSPQTLAKIPK